MVVADPLMIHHDAYHLATLNHPIMETMEHLYLQTLVEEGTRQATQHLQAAYHLGLSRKILSLHLQALIPKIQVILRVVLQVRTLKIQATHRV